VSLFGAEALATKELAHVAGLLCELGRVLESEVWFRPGTSSGQVRDLLDPVGRSQSEILQSSLETGRSSRSWSPPGKSEPWP
jgi:hypothetical protein